MNAEEEEVLLLSDGEGGNPNSVDVPDNPNDLDLLEEDDDDEVLEVQGPGGQEEEEGGSGDEEDVINQSKPEQNGDSEITDDDSRSNDLVIAKVQGGVGLGVEVEEEDDDEVLLVSDEEEEEGDNSVNGTRNVNNKNGVQVEEEEDDDDDDIMEVEDPDPLFGYGGVGVVGEEEEEGDEEVLLQVPKKFNKSNLQANGDSEISEASDSDSKSSNTIVVNDTKSLVDLANSKKEPGGGNKEPTLVIIDTNAIMAGRGAVPVNNNKSNPQAQQKAGGNRPGGGSMTSIDIPDDAYLIEAPSFIVPYVFEQNGEQSLKETIKSLANKVKEVREAKIAKGEELTDEDKITEPRKFNQDDYFESPVGKLLTHIGMNLVQEFVQCDLLKMQKRQGEKEKQKSRMGMMTHLTQQSIISLKKNIDESKENNEPFRAKMRKCELCNFRTESELVMSTHQETPHMKNYSYRCNFCIYTTRAPHEIIYHMEAEHAVRARLERAPAYHQCPSCPFEDNSKAKLTRHLLGCAKRFAPAKNLDPPMDWDTPAKLPKLSKNRVLPHGINPAFLAPGGHRAMAGFNSMLPKQLQAQGLSMKGNLPPLLQAAPKNKPIPGLIRTNNPRGMQNSVFNQHSMQKGMMMRGGQGQMNNNHMLQQVGGSAQMRGVGRPSNQPSISITPLPRQGGSNASTSSSQQKSQGQGGKTSFVICEICDGYIKDLDQLRNHMQWIHKVKIHPKMIYNKPPLNCQKCQFRFFTDQGLERHLLGSHGLVTSSMQDAANKGQDNGRCPLCGKVYQWKLLAHVAKDHNVTLKPAHLSYKCTVCTATFGMYKLFESHVYSAHSVTKNAATRPERRPVAPQQMSGKMGLQVTPRTMPANNQQNSYKPLKINDEITIIPQPMANSGLQRNKGSLTITPQNMRRSLPMRNAEDDGVQIIEIDDAPHKNGRQNGGEIRNRFPGNMGETLRKRNLEISLCDSDNSDDARGPAKRIRHN